MHFLIKKGLGDKIHRAPIQKDVKRIMDIGTGTGIWAIEMGNKYESVSGVELTDCNSGHVPRRRSHGQRPQSRAAKLGGWCSTMVYFMKITNSSPASECEVHRG